jgi:hypothetical protein
MKKLIEDLKAIKQRIKDLDAPTADETYRELVGNAHYAIEECIEILSVIKPVGPKPVGPASNYCLSCGMASDVKICKYCGYESWNDE